jgi:class 3 adenylate cyclase
VVGSCPACNAPIPEDARFCPASGKPVALPAAAGEVRKTVTVVFCDLAGSTEIGERLDAEVLTRVLARYFAEMRVVIEQHGGTVEKYIGDAVMAVFGTPVTHEDDFRPQWLLLFRASAGPPMPRPTHSVLRPCSLVLHS